MGVPPKSSILTGFSMLNHPFWGYRDLWKPPFGHRDYMKEGPYRDPIRAKWLNPRPGAAARHCMAWRLDSGNVLGDLLKLRNRWGGPAMGYP